MQKNYRKIIWLFIIAFISQAQTSLAQKSLNPMLALNFSDDATVQDSLGQYAQRANALWANEQSELSFATDFLAIASQYQAESRF